MSPLGPNDTIPASLGPLGSRWGSALPGWERRIWSREANRELWASHFPELLRVYDNYANPVQRADVVRLAYMHVHGGVYADLDVAPCDSIAPTIAALERERRSVLLVREPGKVAREASSKYLTNFFLASAPGHPFWRFAIGLLRERATHRNVMSATGPYFLNAAWTMYRRAARRAGCADLADASAHVFRYSDWQRTVGAHHFSGTWHFNGSAAHDPNFEAWIGANNSNNCPEADFSAFKRDTWACRKRGFPCPRPTWTTFERECNGTKYGCPRPQKEKRAFSRRRRPRRRVSTRSGEEAAN